MELAELARIERVVVLQTIDLFAACNAEQILRISAIARPQEFAAGGNIYSRKEPAEALYCLVRGQVAITPAEGGASAIGTSMPFGVEDTLSGRLRTEDAEATEETLVLSIGGEDFFDLLANNIDIVRALFRKMLRASTPEGALTATDSL